MPRKAARIACVWAAAAGVVLGIKLAGAPAEEFRFVILGDRTGSAQRGVYEQIWREVDAWDPDMVINVGDTIQGGKDATAAAEWREVRSVFDLYRKYPLFFTPGNHDIWSAFSEKPYRQETERAPYYSFDFAGTHFTVLDNSRSEKLSASQMRFLETDLRHTTARLKFVFFHKPFWLLPVAVGASFPLHRLAKAHAVRYVVSGHAHRFARFEHEGVVYLMVGSSGARLRSNEFEQGWFYHHVRVTVAGSDVAMVIKEADPPFGRSRALTEDDWGSGPIMKRKAARAGR